MIRLFASRSTSRNQERRTRRDSVSLHVRSQPSATKQSVLGFHAGTNDVLQKMKIRNSCSRRVLSRACAFSATAGLPGGCSLQEHPQA